MDRLNAVLETLHLRFDIGCRTCDGCENLPECAGLDVSAFELLQEYVDRCARYADEIMGSEEGEPRHCCRAAHSTRLIRSVVYVLVSGPARCVTTHRRELSLMGHLAMQGTVENIGGYLPANTP